MPTRVLVVAVLLACVGLASIAGESPPPAPDSLVAHLDDAEAAVRDAAAGALVEQGEKSYELLTNAERGDASAKASAARRTRLAITTAKRLAAESQDALPFWMDLEETLRIESAVVRHTAHKLAFDKEWTIEQILDRRDAGRRVAIEFCRTWTDEAGLPPTGGVAESNRRQEEALTKAGAAAAPYLLEILAGDSSPKFRAQARRVWAARDFVFAMYGVRALKLREAVPFLLRWVNGYSAWAHGVALRTLEQLVGKDFGNVGAPLEGAEDRVLASWRENRGPYRVSSGWYLRAQVRELRAILADVIVGASNRNGDFVEWLPKRPPEELKADRLRAAFGDDLPLRFEGDLSARLATVLTAEAWVEDNYAK